MSQDDKDFLFGYRASPELVGDGYITPSPRKTNKSPSSMQSTAKKDNHDWSNTLNLTEHQKQGLVALGLMPDSDFVKNIVTSAKKSSTT